ncbi:hypothetical protein CJO71_11810 [Burkholderia ubonensis]|uniref:Restriction endonuclease subunit S n=1 Tax=Burkholderia ubonensis TaxID=101571 RepID=A0AB74DE27_9BURK|nr:restriction endonuclease subunit S [Burkholderia ubonensis]PAJ80634.1 hypothetical protein CJO71_11810 [Burkholderia ubonensis]PAK00976.1 hypothetical protein CJO68_11860 [Burkholderia ubonensis]RQP83438.1 restriction endonuclease subunit S [Burkholderia ubonensis]RQP90747.1 restriction endonuclease subunit S [Burkholderia ubonensis]
MKASETAEIRELISKVSSWNPAASKDEGTFTYIDLSAIDQDRKVINGARDIPCAEAPSRARQVVQAGDILVSTVRPNLNGVAVVPDDLHGATASTGFCVLRPRAELLDGRYLFHWVKGAAFIQDMVKKATGASYPAVSDRIVQSSTLPLPPIEEQRRIAAILDKVDELRAKRKEALVLLNNMVQSIFVDMFGDPVKNPKGWPMAKLGDVGTLDRGVSKHRPRNDPKLLDGPYPLVQTGDVANSGGYIESSSGTYSEAGLRQSRLWRAGTLCITIAANIAKTGILEFDACFPDSVVGFVASDRATIEYVRIWLSFLQKTLEENAPEVAQKNINLAILRNLDIPLPPIEHRERFLLALDTVNGLSRRGRDAYQCTNQLFKALQSHVFHRKK